MSNTVDASLDGTLAAGSAAPTAPTIASIDEGRRLIDNLDVQLRDLVAVRRDISRQIQALRSADGGPRVQHGRENEIIAAWADELGPRGVEIALAVLTLCRGSLT
ncbi:MULTISPECIES: chorismate mutase [Pseudofrankia]|uniref:chorismate mutase n=1 Tax=Pseudofrankia TaxID=2994363 RepID=UPI000234D98F|nr:MULTISPECIES: chorismate mutase [Pseudofrankia]OHV37898.1 chorismate mutase [Pseudofrankia sp. EUN1h]